MFTFFQILGLTLLLCFEMSCVAEDPSALAIDTSTSAMLVNEMDSVHLVDTTADPLVITKRALLIGINRYEDRRITSLNGARNDVALIQRTLQQYGFESRNIKTLLDRQATKKGILLAFEKLIEQSDSNDVVVIHYSGHGSYVRDLDGDESDGLDETWVVHDSDLRGTNDLTDDELAVLVSRLAERVPNITLLIDSCHSGTLSRFANSSVRLVYRPELAATNDSLDTGRGIDSSAEPFLPENTNYVLYAAARSYEKALEKRFENRDNVYGIFTYHFVETLNENHN